MKRPLFFLFCLLILSILLFYPRTYSPDSVFPQGSSYSVTATGTVESYEKKTSSYVITLKNCQITCHSQSYLCDRLLVSVSEDPDVHAGNQLEVGGKLSSFQPARNPGNMDWWLYYRSLHISYQIRGTWLTVTDDGVFPLSDLLLTLRDHWMEQLSAMETYWQQLSFSFPSSIQIAPILSALLLGNRADLPDETYDLYETAGILPLLTISGLHISLIGGGFLWIGKRLRLPLWLRSLLASFLLLLYWQLCGGKVSAGRAVVLFLVMNFAPVCKRSYDPLSALSLAGILFLLDSPLLLFQSSFQLSFGAMLGVLLLEPTMASFLSRLPLLCKAPSGLLKSFSFSLSIQLALFPLTLYHFYRYPLYALWANLLVLPTASFLLLFAIAGLFLSYFSLAVGAWVSLPCRVLLWMYEKICQGVSLLPGASSLLGRPLLIRILLYYLICLGLIFLPKKISSVSSKKGTLISCLLFGSLLPVLLLPLPHNELKITVVDVGQGDCTLICPPSGTTILIDGGSSDLSQVAQDRLIPFLESQGIGELDYVFLSHTDADHVNALEGWLEDGHLIGTIILPELNQTLSQEPSYQGILQLADTYQIPLLTFHAGDSWQEQELSLLCLGPQAADSKEGSSYGSLNAASMVLYLEYEGIRILFPGDCDEEGETFLLQELKERNLSCDILKAAHHGSRTATSTELLQQLQPSLCLISCGVQNTYGHPSPEMLARLEEKGIPYYVTARQGALFLTIRHGKVRFQTMLPS